MSTPHPDPNVAPEGNQTAMAGTVGELVDRAAAEGVIHVGGFRLEYHGSITLAERQPETPSPHQHPTKGKNMARNATQDAQDASQHAAKPWDTPGLPARAQEDRCRWHNGYCAYHEDDPTRCCLCHTDNARCTCDGGPWTAANVDRIRDRFIGGDTAKDIAADEDLSTRHVLRLLTGLHPRAAA